MFSQGSEIFDFRLAREGIITQLSGREARNLWAKTFTVFGVCFNILSGLGNLRFPLSP